MKHWQNEVGNILSYEYFKEWYHFLGIDFFLYN